MNIFRTLGEFFFFTFVKTAYYVFRRTFWAEKKREHVQCELENSGEKTTQLENDFSIIKLI